MNKNMIFKNFTSNLSEDELKYIVVRLENCLPGDRADVINLVSKNKDMHLVLDSAKNSNELFDLVDEFARISSKELEYRKKHRK